MTQPTWVSHSLTSRWDLAGAAQQRFCSRCTNSPSEEANNYQIRVIYRDDQNKPSLFILSTMAKAKTGVPNKALHSRVSYLYQAAAYLATQQQHSKTLTKDSQPADLKYEAMANLKVKNISDQSPHAAARHLISDLRAVSLKVQLRISPAMKHSICKNCDTMLINGTTCSSEVENRSKGGRKPWADVLVQKCNTCGSARRYPIGAERQKRRPHRSPREQAATKSTPKSVETLDDAVSSSLPT